MKAPDTPPDEEQRLAALRELDILDTEPEERFDRLTRIAQRLFGVPISLVSLVDEDRQWFKSAVGLDAPETGRDISFCGHAILGDESFEVPDAASDERFADNPLVTGNPNIRFYAGYPLRAPGGEKLGTLCVIDTQPRELTPEDRQVLKDLATLTERELAVNRFALVDELTGIANRRGFLVSAERTVGIAVRHGVPVSLAYFDLNKFKPINDRFGHAEGDRALKTFSSELEKHLRSTDICGRLGGDEFVALMAGADEARAKEVVDRFRVKMATVNRAAARGYDIVFSVGIVERSEDGPKTIGELLEEADSRMYAEKNAEPPLPA